MVFSNWDYIFPGIVIPAFVVISLLIIATIIGRKLSNKNYPVVYALIPVAVWLILFLVGLAFFAKGFVYPFSIALQSNLPTQVTSGQISAITNAPAVPSYYNPVDRSFHPAVFITVNGEDYYALSCNAEVGDQITLEWTTNERIIKSINMLSSGQSETVLFASNPPEKNNVRKMLGQTIRNISMILLVCLSVLQYPLGKRIAPFLQQKDTAFTGGTVPNKYGLLHFGLVTIPLLGVLIGAGIAGLGGAYLIAFMGGIVFSFIILTKQTTRVYLDADELILKNIFSTQAFPLSEVADIYWRRAAIPYNRGLVITFQAGNSLVFEQINNWGLQDLYNSIQKRTGKAADGSLS